MKNRTKSRLGPGSFEARSGCGGASQNSCNLWTSAPAFGVRDIRSMDLKARPRSVGGSNTVTAADRVNHLASNTESHSIRAGLLREEPIGRQTDR